MRTLKYILTAAMAAALAFASCTQEIEAPEENGQEEGSYSRETGAPVVFGVSTGDDNKAKTKAEEYSEEIFASVNGKLQKIGEVAVGYDDIPETKADYSGAIAEGKERINWETDDRLDIFCVQASAPENRIAEYKLSGTIFNTDFNSKAYIEKAGATGLRWGDDNLHSFFAAYPKLWDGTLNNFNKVIEVIPFGSNNEHKVIAEVPEVQDDGNKPIILSAKNTDKRQGGPVILNFRPAVNTFDITLINTRRETVNIKKVELVAPLEKISGTYGIIIHGEKEKRDYLLNEARLAQNNKVTRIFQEPYALAPGQSCKVRLYTLPVSIQRLILSLDLGNENINLELKSRYGYWMPFWKEEKYNLKNIKIPSSVENLNYTFSVTPDTLTFYPFYMRYPNMGTKIINSIFVKSFCVNADGSKNEAVPWGYYGVDWLDKSSNYYESLPGNADDNSANLISLNLKDFDPEDNATRADQMMNLLESAPLIDYDLSTKGGTTPRYTANCYVVKQRGHYKFPVVYGNGIQNGRISTAGYRTIAGEATIDAARNILTEFLDGGGHEISSTDIYFDAAKVSLVWEDSQELVEKLYLQRGSDGKQYIHFTIDENIAYGNALIAAHGNDGTILWTWHIWVTDIDFNKGTGQFLSVPLGYRPELEDVPEKVRSLELKQVDLKGKSKTIYAKTLYGWTYPSCLYYKSGVMRPLIPTYRLYIGRRNSPAIRSRFTTSLAKCYTGEFNSDGRRVSTEEFRLSKALRDKNISEAISSPGEVFELERRYWNLWNNNYTRYSDLQEEVGTTKTVYDPSPVGYMMPTPGLLRNIPYSVKDRFRMGGYTIDIMSVAGRGLMIPVYNFAEICDLLGARGFYRYPEGAQGDATDECAIIPIRDTVAVTP